MPPLLKKKNCNKKNFGYNLNKNIFHSKIFLMTNIEIEILFILGLIMVILYNIRCTIFQGLSGKDGMLGAPGERGESVSTLEIYPEKKV